jgi:hypothetical protein
MITGVIRDIDGETIPMVAVFDSDSSGNLIQGGSATSSDFDGVYKISPKSDFVTFRMSGFRNEIVRRSALNSNPNITMQSLTNLKPVEVFAERIVEPPKKEKKKFKIKPIHIILGVGLMGAVIGTIVYVKSLKK